MGARTEHVRIDIDVEWIAPADLDAVDALARLQLAAMRRGRRLALERASAELLDLLGLVGLRGVFVSSPPDGAPASGPLRRGRSARRSRDLSPFERTIRSMPR